MHNSNFVTKLSYTCPPWSFLASRKVFWHKGMPWQTQFQSHSVTILQTVKLIVSDGEWACESSAWLWQLLRACFRSHRINTRVWTIVSEWNRSEFAKVWFKVRDQPTSYGAQQWTVLLGCKSTGNVSNIHSIMTGLSSSLNKPPKNANKLATFYLTFFIKEHSFSLLC